MSESADALRVDKVVTTGIIKLDGVDCVVHNNVWIVGGDSDVVVFDASHLAEPIIDAVNGRNVTAIVCTHGHEDHVTVAPELGEMLYAPILMHPADDRLWRQSHGDARYWQLHDGQRIGVAGTEFRAIHTPGHSAGSTCLYFPEVGGLLTGDALFPGAVPPDRPMTPTDHCSANREKVLTLPEATLVYAGHGDCYTIGQEAARSTNWQACAG